MWQPRWEESLGENGYMCTYGRVPLLSTGNYHNIVNWLFFNRKQVFCFVFNTSLGNCTWRNSLVFIIGQSAKHLQVIKLKFKEYFSAQVFLACSQNKCWNSRIHSLFIWIKNLRQNIKPKGLSIHVPPKINEVKKKEKDFRNVSINLWGNTSIILYPWNFRVVGALKRFSNLQYTFSHLRKPSEFLWDV